MDESHKVHYERVPMHNPHGFTVPADVIDRLGRGSIELGYTVLHDTLGGHVLDGPIIRPDVVRAIGHNDPVAGRKVLSRFIQKVRKQNGTEDKSTKAANVRYWV